MFWAISICAIHKKPKPEGGNEVSVRHAALVIDAPAHEEALSKGWLYAVKKYQPNKSWQMHDVCAARANSWADVAVPVEQVEEEATP